MRVRLELTNHGKAGYVVRAPRSLVKGRRRVVVRVGQREVSVHCSSGPAQATLGLSPALMAKMHLRRGMRLHARFDGRVLHIGPLVGILVPATTGLPNPVGNMTLGVRYFIEQARTVGVYAFAFPAAPWISNAVRSGATRSVREASNPAGYAACFRCLTWCMTTSRTEGATAPPTSVSSEPD